MATGLFRRNESGQIVQVSNFCLYEQRLIETNRRMSMKVSEILLVTISLGVHLDKLLLVLQSEQLVQDIINLNN